jgi:hypothetical protein
MNRWPEYTSGKLTPGWADLTGATVVARVLFTDEATEYPCTVITPTGVNQHIHLNDLTKTVTKAMPGGLYTYDLVATLASLRVVTLVKGRAWPVVVTADAESTP